MNVPAFKVFLYKPSHDRVQRRVLRGISAENSSIYMYNFGYYTKICRNSADFIFLERKQKKWGKASPKGEQAVYLNR